MGPFAKRALKEEQIWGVERVWACLSLLALWPSEVSRVRRLCGSATGHVDLRGATFTVTKESSRAGQKWQAMMEETIATQGGVAGDGLLATDLGKGWDLCR